ncbi:MAG: hypothetical protein IM638_00540 [Bacteroidetes bacterium]|nr:hypothetical protein [Bacteroidota bacterium]
MNLFKIKPSAVKTVQNSAPAQTLSIEAMKKVMGGGAYNSHCCVKKAMS